MHILKWYDLRSDSKSPTVCDSLTDDGKAF